MKKMGDKFRTLQKHWYKILEDSGFKDIEKLVDGKLFLKEIAPHSFWYMDEFECEMRGEYYRAISKIAFDENTLYKNDVDRMILQMHAEGIKISAIMNALKMKGESKHRLSIRYIIRRYEMAWKIRHYTPKQLNKKCP